MEKLLSYINSLPAQERDPFARACRTTLGYLRKAISKGQALGESLCINIERESKRSVLCEDLRPDVDWAYLRGTVRNAESTATECASGASRRDDDRRKEAA